MIRPGGPKPDKSGQAMLPRHIDIPACRKLHDSARPNVPSGTGGHSASGIFDVIFIAHRDNAVIPAKAGICRPTAYWPTELFVLRPAGPDKLPIVTCQFSN